MKEEALEECCNRGFKKGKSWKCGSTLTELKYHHILMSS